jgi:hypothetical protein
MVSVTTSSSTDCDFDPRSGQIKDCNICLCCFSAKHATLRRTIKDCLTLNEDNVSELGYMSIRELAL